MRVMVVVEMCIRDRLLIVQLAVGGGSRVDDKALHISDVGEQREQLPVSYTHLDVNKRQGR